MLQFAVETGKNLFEVLPEPRPPIQEAEASLEAMVFFLHLLDRAAFERLGPFKRRVFMDAILEGMSKTSRPAGLRSDAFRDLWNEKQNEYAAFQKLYPEDGEPWKGTLCWEFAKRLGMEYGNSNPARITLIASGAISMIALLREALGALLREALGALDV